MARKKQALLTAEQIREEVDGYDEELGVFGELYQAARRAGDNARAWELFGHQQWLRRQRRLFIIAHNPDLAPYFNLDVLR